MSKKANKNKDKLSRNAGKSRFARRPIGERREIELDEFERQQNKKHK